MISLFLSTSYWRCRVHVYPCHFLQSANPQVSEKAQGHTCTLKLWVCTCCTLTARNAGCPLYSTGRMLCHRQRLQDDCQTRCWLSLPSCFFLFSLLKVFLLLLNFGFGPIIVSLKRLFLIPWQMGLGHALSDSFRHSIHMLVYTDIPILAVVALQPIWSRWRSVQAPSHEFTLVFAQGLKQRESKLLSF